MRLGVSLGEGIRKDFPWFDTPILATPQAAPVSRGVYPEATPNPMSPRKKRR